MTPFEITVLMPVYNGEKYLREAIDSVLSQTFSDFEFLIINDGSTDSTEEIIKSYTDPRIKLISQKNGGVSAALNTGLKNANGKYIARFDADDICFPNRLQVQYEFLIKNPDYILVGSDAEYMTEEGEYIFTFHNKGYDYVSIEKYLFDECPFIHSSVMYIKHYVLELGGYDIKALTFEDYFLWVKLIEKGKFCNLNTSLIKVRFNPASVTVDGKDYSEIFKKLHYKAIHSGIITDEESILISENINKLSKQKKESSYHRMLGKKFLWNNYQPKKSRLHLLKSFKLEPLNMTCVLLICMSFLPKIFINKIYRTLK